MTKVQQSTTGDNSPTFCGDHNSYNNFTEVKEQISNEVRTMLFVIAAIRSIAEKSNIKADTINYPKDISLKLGVRFREFEKELTSRFCDLDALYRGAYEEAITTSEIDEFSYEELCSLLSNLSLKILSQKKNNPIEALEELTEFFKKELSRSTELTFSQQAAEYFLYKQLIVCNVFPNPKINFDESQ